MQRNLIGITSDGYGAGKDSVAAVLALNFDYLVWGFSEVLKDQIFHDLTYKKFENKNLWLEYCEENKYKESWPRKLLQSYGQFYRSINPDYWVDSWEKSIQDSKGVNIAVPSVRFPNEAKRIKELGGYLVRVTRPGIKVDDDPSETSMTDYPVDYSIINDGSLLDLRERVHKMMKDLRLKERTDGIATTATGHTEASQRLK